MRKLNSKRRNPSHSSSSKTAKQTNAAAQTTHKPVKSKPQPHPSSAKQTERIKTKRARILAMLRAPRGATVEAMMRATGWQRHSVRGFLAGVIRKKLRLNLVATAAEGGRIYRIADQTAARLVAAKASQAA